jgi:hypothetical protein
MRKPGKRKRLQFFKPFDPKEKSRADVLDKRPGKAIKLTLIHEGYLNIVFRDR